MSDVFPIKTKSGKTAEVPLSAYPMFKTRELDVANDRVAQIFCSHRLSPVAGRENVKAMMNHVPLGDMSLNYLQYGAEVEIAPQPLEDFFLVKYLLQGQIELETGQGASIVRSGTASVISPQQQAKMRWSRNSKNLIVKIEKDALEKCLSNILGAHLPDPLVFDVPGPPREDANNSWRHSLMYIQSELKVVQDQKLPVPMQKTFADLCKLSLIYHQPHNYSRYLATGLSRAAPHYVKRAEDYIAANLKNGVTIDDLVRISGVSARSLFAGFKEYRGISPMKFIHEQRLHKAHEELKKNDQGKTITEIATKWGFSQLGRFSGEYKKQFGVSPSDTVRRFL